jgi:hypothetical protein
MDNYQNLNLNELKTILYINKNLQDDIKKEINDIIKNKIKLSNTHCLLGLPNDVEYNTQSDGERSIYIESSDDTDKSTDIDTFDEQNYKENIKKLYNRVNKKEENERFTQSSRKLYDRMFSEASYINDIGKYKINNISKPFTDNNINQQKLGNRKKIIKI